MLDREPIEGRLDGIDRLSGGPWELFLHEEESGYWATGSQRELHGPLSRSTGGSINLSIGGTAGMSR